MRAHCLLLFKFLFQIILHSEWLRSQLVLVEVCDRSTSSRPLNFHPRAVVFYGSGWTAYAKNNEGGIEELELDGNAGAE